MDVAERANTDDSKLGRAGAGRSVLSRVSEILQKIRPAIQADGGDLELIEVTAEHVVRVRLHGACVGCPSSMVTLRAGIEQNLRDHVPEVTGVEAVE